MAQGFALRPVEPHEGGGRVVLRNLSEEIRECLQHAEDCARKAAAQSCPNLKQDFLDLEQRWLYLARSYEFTERLTDLCVENKRNVDKLSKAY
jgi:hemerythrin-like domain-containing protein